MSPKTLLFGDSHSPSAPTGIVTLNYLAEPLRKRALQEQEESFTVQGPRRSLKRPFYGYDSRYKENFSCRFQFPGRSVPSRTAPVLLLRPLLPLKAPILIPTPDCSDDEGEEAISRMLKSPCILLGQLRRQGTPHPHHQVATLKLAVPVSEPTVDALTMAAPTVLPFAEAPELLVSLLKTRR
jgi:hypothetical protein